MAALNEPNPVPSEAVVESKEPTQLKATIIGDLGIGKVSFCRSFVGTPPDLDTAAAGGRFYDRTFDRHGRAVTLRLWSPHGEERFRSLSGIYYRGAYGIMIAYSTASKESLRRLDDWLLQARNHCRESVSLLVVGLQKEDTPDDPDVVKAGEAWAKSQGIQHVVLSCSKRDSEKDAAVMIPFIDKMLATHNAEAQAYKLENPVIVYDRPTKADGVCICS